jgi:hypothetical protein
MADPLAEPTLWLQSPGAVGYVLTAGFLGVTHGIEPDHVAGIGALTHEAEDSRLSALVGGCFAAGHALLVVAWIVAAYAIVGSTSFPPVFERLGTLLVGVVLAVVSLSLGVTGARKLVHRHRHEHGGGTHSHFHTHLPASLRLGSADDDHAHEHSTVEYLKIGTVGALFTLSPPVSMIAFISVTAAEGGVPLLAGIVAAYTLTIVATMTAVGGGVGSLFRLSKARGQRVHAVSQVVASVVILGFAVSVLAGLGPAIL